MARESRHTSWEMLPCKWEDMSPTCADDAAEWHKTVKVPRISPTASFVMRKMAVSDIYVERLRGPHMTLTRPRLRCSPCAPRRCSA